jgi:hypothetical protein
MKYKYTGKSGLVTISPTKSLKLKNGDIVDLSICPESNFIEVEELKKEMKDLSTIKKTKKRGKK